VDLIYLLVKRVFVPSKDYVLMRIKLFWNLIEIVYNSTSEKAVKVT